MNFLLPLLWPDFKPPRGIKGEDAICLDICNFLREQTLTKAFSYIWFHVPNEFSTYRGAYGALKSWIGRIAGVPDYVFLGKEKCFFIEVKSKKGVQSEKQILFQKWCEKVGVPYYICRSLDDFKAITYSI